jgi:DNA-directed RNA polymerase specialized sigma24 family protein
MTPSNHTPLPAESARFTTTDWTVIHQAADGGSAEAREAWSSLCQTYWPPLYAFIRRQGYDPDEAQDLAQEFFYRFLRTDPLSHVSSAAGKFRSFLLACLKHFLADERDRARSQRRGGGRPVISLDSAATEMRLSLEPIDEVTPEVLFDRHWAFMVVDRSLAALRQACAQRAEGLTFEELEGFLPRGRGSASRAELAAKHGMSLNAIDVAIYRVRQRFGVLLRQQVAQTVSSEAEAEEEIRYLISVLGG